MTVGLHSTRCAVRVALLVTVGLWHAGAQAADVRLMIISLDGMRADVVSAENTPNIAALRDAGSHAAEALNDLPAATLTNHTTMLTGLVTRRHGVILDTELPGSVDALTLFDAAWAAGQRCAFYASKAKLAFLAPPDVLEIIQIADPEPLVEMVLEQLTADGPDLFFVHLREPDSTGHRAGWLSDEYLQAARRMDVLVGEIVAAVEADDARDTYVIVTADHGGEGLGHVLNTPEVRRIPWIVSGPDIQPGGVLSDTVAIADTMPTALWLLGVEVPAGLCGTARTEVKTGLADGNGLGRSPVPAISLPCIVLALPVFLALGVLAEHAARRST